MTIADGGTLAVEIASDGSLVMPAITGSLAAAGGGSVVLSGAFAALTHGEHSLGDATGAWNGWTAAFADGKRHGRSLRVRAVGGELLLVSSATGTVMIVK